MERADVTCDASERIEYDPLGRAHPFLGGDEAIARLKFRRFDAEGPNLSCHQRGISPAEEGQQTLDRERVEDLRRRGRRHDVEERRPLNLRVPALIKIEQDVAKAASGDHFLDRRVGILEAVA